MTDTVTRLMALADEYHRSFDSGNINGSIDRSRQALQDELQKLFTPLSDEQINTACESLGFGALSWCAVTRAVEAAHGIGEAK